MTYDLYEKEAQYLAPYAVKSINSAGRKFSENQDDKRLCFQRDKDRIIHCKAFRRLDEKTQVFVAGSGDHYRTRLTHTLEVAQISRDLARRLSINEDLCEAIALAHDLGHPPFGHAGESALNEIMEFFGMRFEHNEQSRRVVEILEKSYPNFDGLNLTFEVLDGLIKHKSAWDQLDKNFETFPHLEAQIVNAADEIAYTNHDMDDGLRSGFIRIEQLEEFELWRIGADDVFEKYGKIENPQVLISRIVSSIISIMINDLVRQTARNLKKNKINSVEAVREYRGILADFSEKMRELVKELRQFLYANLYFHPKIESVNLRGRNMTKKLFEFYYKNPDQFPKKDYLRDDTENAVAIKDYIAGMTDSFLIKEFNKI